MLIQNDPYVMHKRFDPPISPEALERMSFEEKYEGFCVDLIKVLSPYGHQGTLAADYTPERNIQFHFQAIVRTSWNISDATSSRRTFLLTDALLDVDSLKEVSRH